MERLQVISGPSGDQYACVEHYEEDAVVIGPDIKVPSRSTLNTSPRSSWIMREHSTAGRGKAGSEQSRN